MKYRFAMKRIAESSGLAPLSDLNAAMSCAFAHSGTLR